MRRNANAVLVLGLAFYVFTAARFDLHELFTGHGDHWVAGGALAISALAAGKITEAAGALGQFSEQHQILTASTLVLWCLAMVWLFPLIAGEVLRPRLSYDVRRWATVFPLGMYAACSFTAGQVTGISGIARFGHVWTWVAFTVSLLVLAGLFRHSWPVLRGQRTPRSPALLGQEPAPRAPQSLAWPRLASAAGSSRRADLELGEDLAQVPFDGPGGQEQVGADLRVGLPVPRQPGDGRLLRGERVRRLGGTLAGRLAGGQQLAPGPFGKCPGTHSGQHLVRGPQLDAGVRPAALWLSDTFAAACLHGQRWSCTEPRPLMETLPPLAPGAVRWRRRWRGRQWRRSPKLARLGRLVLAERSGRPPRPTSRPGRSLNWRGDTLRLARSAKEGAVGGE
jgi:Voltage-dependent anion channel